MNFQNVNNFISSNFTVINPPSTRPFVFKMTTYYNFNNLTPYAMETLTTDMYQCIKGNIINAIATPVLTDVNTNTSYTITFTIQHTLVSGSFINVVFPP
jgi:hypothetical protein